MVAEPLWEDGGLVDEETGRLLGARVSSADWLVPYQIRLHDDDGEEALWLADTLGQPVSAAPEMLQEFLGLADAPGEAILAYARRWGLLGLRPEPYRPIEWPFAFERPREGQAPRVRLWSRRTPTLWPPSPYGSSTVSLGYRHSDVGGEPVVVWRDLAGQMRALLNVTARLRQDKSGHPQDWHVLASLVRFTLPPEPTEIEQAAAIAAVDAGIPVVLLRPDTIADQRAMVTVILASLLRLAEVGPRPWWGPNEARPQLTLGGHGLLAALVLRLVSAIAGLDALAVCSACGQAYLPKRRPAVGKRHYCTACRQAHKPQRAAEAAYRARRRGQDPALEREENDR